METLRQILCYRKMSQAALARAMGTTEATVSRYITGKITPPNVVLQKIAAVLQVEVGEITGQVPFMSDDERATLLAYRDAPEGVKEAVRAMLRAISGADRKENLRGTQESD